MVQQNFQTDPLVADLFDAAMAAAYPDRFGSYTNDPETYRIPLDRLSSYMDGLQADDGSLALIDWTPALRAAYQDGYDPLIPLGSGCSSSVWRCIDRSFGREVALKFIHDDTKINSDRAFQTLQDEAELLGRLQHPGIVQAVRRSGTGQSSYLAIDFVDGDNLLVHAGLSQLDAKSLIRLFARTLDAVAYLHTKGIVHGDIKPDHILIRENNQPILIDFGLSSFYSEGSLHLSAGQQIGGSGHYRAPEIASATANEPKPQHDVYSLGVLLSELIEGVDLGDARQCVEYAIQEATQENITLRPKDAHALLELLQPALTTRPFDDSPTAVKSSAVQPWQLVAMAVLVLGMITVAVLWPNSDEAKSINDQSGETQRLAAQASLFDLALQDVYAGDTLSATNRLAALNQVKQADQAPWEKRHIQNMLKGQGEAYPFGEFPYEAPYVLSVDYDPTTDTIAYVTLNEGQYLLWVRSLTEAPRLVYASSNLIMDVALGRGATRLAIVKELGETIAWQLDSRRLQPSEQYTLPRERSDRLIWFGEDGQSLFLLSPSERNLECWVIGEEKPTKPSFVIDDCDHAYPLASGEGMFIVATHGLHTNSGRTQLRAINVKGEITRTIELEDGNLPSSADMGSDPNAILCLGMPNGYVRIYNVGQGGWQPHVDLGTNSVVTTILIQGSEDRIFAALGRINVIDMSGDLLMRLGNRDDSEHLVTQFVFDEDESTLTSVSVQDVWRCIGK